MGAEAARPECGSAASGSFLLSSLDDGVGRVLGALRKHGLEENTLVSFLSDNGGPTAELTSSNKPLRGGKGQLYEGGIRVAFFA